MKICLVILLLIMGCAKEERKIQQVQQQKPKQESIGFETIQRQSSADMIEYQTVVLDSSKSTFTYETLSP